MCLDKLTLILIVGVSLLLEVVICLSSEYINGRELGTSVLYTHIKNTILNCCCFFFLFSQNLFVTQKSPVCRAFGGAFELVTYVCQQKEFLRLLTKHSLRIAYHIIMLLIHSWKTDTCSSESPWYVYLIVNSSHFHFPVCFPVCLFCMFLSHLCLV